MGDSWTDRPEVVVAAIGGPDGDDQVGWRVAGQLRRWADFPARVVLLSEGIELLEHLDGCQRLIIIDARRSLTNAERITRCRWPDAQPTFHSSTRGVAIVEALQLADEMGRIPPVVEIIGIEVRNFSTECELLSAVLEAAVDLEARIFDEICEASALVC